MPPPFHNLFQKGGGHFLEVLIKKREKLALCALLLFQLLLLWFNSGLEPLLFGAHHSTALLFRVFFCLLVWVARFYFFPRCRDPRMLLLGSAGIFLFLVFFNRCLPLGKTAGLTYFLSLFDQGLMPLLGVVFEITAVVVWEVTASPEPFGFALHAYAQRRKASEAVLSSLMKLGFFYAALLVLGFNRLRFTPSFLGTLQPGNGLFLVGSIAFLLAGFRERLRSHVCPACDEIERELEAL